MSYQVLARRWRPLRFEAVVGQGPLVRTLQNALARGRIAHAYLFAGPRGVGKTTTARLLAMGLNCERPRPGEPVPCASCGPCREVIAGRALDVIEIDGASNRGIDEVRALRESTRYAPARGRWKVYIIDEVHMLTEPAFNALLKTLEEPPAHVVFVLATTEARRLPATILSRCQRFDFRPIGADEIAASLERILAEEAARAGIAVEVDPGALRLIARAADGSFRDALSLLDTALAYGEGQVTAGAVEELLGSGGAETARAFAGALVRRAAAEALGRIEQAAVAGLDLGLLCREATEMLRRGLLVRVLAAPPADVTPDEATWLAALGSGETEDLLLLLKGLVDAEAEMRRSPHPRVDLEVAAVRLCHRPETQTLDRLLERLERAETELRGHGSGLTETVGPVQTDLLGGPELDARHSAAPPRAAPRPPSPAVGGRSPAPAAEPTAPPSPPEPEGPRGLAEAWKRIVADVTRTRPTLGHVLADAVVETDDGGRLRVTVPDGSVFVQDQLGDRASRRLLLDTVRRVLPGVRDVVSTAATPPPGGDTGRPVEEHPTVQATVELFNGDVTVVRSARPSSSPGSVLPDSASRESGEPA